MDEELSELSNILSGPCDPTVLSNVSTQRRSQALLVASRRGKTELVLFLLNNGARPNIEDELGCTPLMFVAVQGMSECMEAMIKTPGCIIHKRNDSLRTALHFAAEKGRSDCVAILIKHGAMVNVSDDWGMTPLILAVNSGSEDSVACLLNNGAQLEMTDLRGFNALVHASRGGHAAILRLLLRQGCHVNLARKTSPIHQASTFGHVDCVQLLLEAGAWTNIRDIHSLLPLELATQTDQLSVVQYLLDSSPQCSADVNNALASAARHNAPKCLEAILTHGGNPEVAMYNGIPALFIAVEQNNVDVVKVLIKHHCDVNRSFRKTAFYNTELRDLCMTLKSQQVTALVIAILRGYHHMILILLHAGAKTGPFSDLLLNNQVPDAVLHHEQLMLWLLHRASRPLSLMEMSRECVRQRLVLSKKPGLTSHLPVPAAIQSYLAYSDMDDI